MAFFRNIAFGSAVCLFSSAALLKAQDALPSQLWVSQVSINSWVWHSESVVLSRSGDAYELTVYDIKSEFGNCFVPAIRVAKKEVSVEKLRPLLARAGVCRLQQQQVEEMLSAARERLQKKPSPKRKVEVPVEASSDDQESGADFEPEVIGVTSDDGERSPELDPRTGVVALCDSVNHVLEFSNLPSLTEVAPALGRLEDLASAMMQRTSGDEAAMREAESEADPGRDVEELRTSGLDQTFWYGECLGQAWSDDWENYQTDIRKHCDLEDFQRLVGTYTKEASKWDQSGARIEVSSEGADPLRRVNAMYPPIARTARIEGKVILRVLTDPQSGDVRSVSVISGHPMLVQAAIDSIKQWIFDPHNLSSGAFNVTFDFLLNKQCPVRVQTEAARIARKRSRRAKRTHK